MAQFLQVWRCDREMPQLWRLRSVGAAGSFFNKVHNSPQVQQYGQALGAATEKCRSCGEFMPQLLHQFEETASASEGGRSCNQEVAQLRWVT